MWQFWKNKAALAEETNTGRADALASYYAEGQRWDDQTYRQLRQSRSRAWTFAGGCLLIAAGSVFALSALIPLKQFEPYVISVDKTTGFTEITRALQPGTVQQQEAVTVANLVRYLKARETYDAREIKSNFDLAALYSADVARDDLIAQWSPGNPKRPDLIFKRDTSVSVKVKAVSLLNERTASIRFQTDEKTAETVTERHWVAIVKFRYSAEPMKNEWRFDNPLGFQVVSYRRDQETLGTVEHKQ